MGTLTKNTPKNMRKNPKMKSVYSIRGFYFIFEVNLQLFLKNGSKTNFHVPNKWKKHTNVGVIIPFLFFGYNLNIFLVMTLNIK